MNRKVQVTQIACHGDQELSPEPARGWPGRWGPRVLQPPLRAPCPPSPRSSPAGSPSGACFPDSADEVPTSLQHVPGPGFLLEGGPSLQAWPWRRGSLLSSSCPHCPGCLRTLPRRVLALPPMESSAPLGRSPLHLHPCVVPWPHPSTLPALGPRRPFSSLLQV